MRPPLETSSRKPAAYRYDAELPPDSALLEELLRATEIQELFESYYSLMNIPVAVIDLKANVLLSSCWRRICTQFHRNHPLTCARCIESDTLLASHLQEGKNYAIYACRNGLTDCASPIIIEGRHIANVFIGQFLTQEADEGWFIRQAARCGFDRADYLAALREVPVVDSEKVPLILDLLARMTRVITKLGIDRKRAVESQTRQSIILDTIPQSVFWKDKEGTYLGCNAAFARAAGLNQPEDVVGRTDFDLPWPRHEAEAYRADDMKVISSNQARLHIVEPLQLANGSRIVIDTSKVPLASADNTPYGVVGIYEDVTERKDAEERIKASEARFRALSEYSLAGVYIIQDYRISYVNPSLAKLFGYSPREVLGMDPLSVVHPDDREFAAESMRLRLSGAVDSLHYECRGLRKNGEIIHIEVLGGVVELDGRPAIVGNILDITERKQAEDIRKHLASIVEFSDDAIIGKSCEGVIQSWNTGAQRLYGYTSAETIGQSVTLLVPPDRLNEVGDILNRIKKGEVIEHFETVRLCKDATQVDVSVTVSPIRDADGRVIGASTIARDITARKRAEEALRLNETRLEALLKLSQMTTAPLEEITAFALEQGVVLTKSKIGYLAFLNEAETVLTMHSWSEAAMKECAISSKPLVYPVESTGLWGEAVRQRRPVITNDYAAPNLAKKGFPAGHVPIVRHMNVPIFDGSRIVVVAGVGNKEDDYDDADVRQLTLLMDAMWQLLRRREAAKRLKESEDKFRKAFMTGADAFYIATLHEGKLIEANDRFSGVFGYSHEEIRGRTSLELRLYADPEDRRRMVSELKSKGVVRDLELKGRKKSGELITVLLSTNILQGADEQLILGVVRDVTAERRAAEALIRLRKAVDASGEVVFMTDRDGIITSVNPEFTRLYGYAPEEVVGKQTPSVLKSGAMAPDYYREFWKTVLGKQVARGEIVNMSKDGHQVTVESSVNPIQDERGEITGFLAIQRDVTDRKKLEEQFRQAQKMEAVGRLAGGVAHDFNNLLSIINGNAGFLLESINDDDPRLEDVHEIITAAERATSLTRQLLAFSRKQVIQPRVLDLNSVLANLGKMLCRLIGEDIRLIVDSEPDLGHVMIDPGQVEQMILNLSINARDAMPGGGTLTIETGNVTLNERHPGVHDDVLPGDYVELVVSDTGCGMSAETLGHIFEPFFTTKEAGRGTGLGLSTVYGIVKQAGGYIGVRSEVGHGSSFRIFLPRMDMPVEKSGAETKLEKRLSGSETILVAEDEPSLGAVIRKNLERHGYRVLLALSPEEAITLAGNHAETIHLLLTDIVMPGFSGKDLAERLLISRPGLKVLFASGYSDDAITHHGILDEGVAFLTKPFSSDTLLRRVRKLLDGQH